ncbi:G-type lectin S-receptor-like serine/threonine-protein kinase LECRK3 [Gossypium hirsutum]|uniref:G-type lectin S-receptor-like serine/threonine-protein kinase LECRK3 n=1 Tax=Gossypium hirsutum TaxID=3635 RepID=A0A1U8MTW1_GOSHI|nr:G-type lectin S-receptor-like serine/threonine-protein kinase LECRK3 [Gossypium hirsutum]
MAFLVLLLLLNFVLNATNAQSTSSIIKPGSSLSPINNPYLLSPSGQFAFGFYRYKNGYSVGIWFENIQQKTIVWTDNRDASPYPSDVTLVLTTEGTLIVRPKQGQDVLIADTSSDDVSRLATSASMLDSGNFVLLNSSGGIVWKSFDFPTDTILPGQRLAVTGKLVSSVAVSDHGSGKFLILMQTDGNLVQYPVGAVELGAGYWDTETFNAGNGVNLNLDGNGHLYLLNDTGFNIKSINTNYVNASGKSVYRATIDTDGIFRLYSHSSNRFDDWYTEWSSSNDRCNPLGLCGENSYCVMMDEEPVCQCPFHFDFINEKRQELGCRKNYSLVACDTRNDQTFDFLEVNDVSWKDDAYLSLSSKTKNSCRDECYRDCSCEAAVFKNELCKMMKLPVTVWEERIKWSSYHIFKDWRRTCWC